MSAFAAKLTELETESAPSLMDRIREHLPEMELARTRGTPWKIIHEALAAEGIAISSPVLANYVCLLRQESKPTPEAPAGAAPARALLPFEPPRAVASTARPPQRRRDDLIEGPDVE